MRLKSINSFKVKSWASKSEFLAECLSVRLAAMTEGERKFARYLLDFLKYRGAWSEKQVAAAERLAARLMIERDN